MRLGPLLLLLLTSGCSLDMSFDGVDIGDSLQRVQRRHPDLQPTGEGNALAKKERTPGRQTYVRYPEDGPIVAVVYGFEDETLRGMIVGFDPQVDIEQLARQAGVHNGEPQSVRAGGGRVFSWERPGQELILMQLPNMPAWDVEGASEDDEPPRQVQVGFIMWAKQLPGAEFYPLLVAGMLLCVLGMLVTMQVAIQRLKAGAPRSPAWVKPTASALALATGACCMTGYGLELFGCVELLCLVPLGLGYPLDRTISRLEALAAMRQA